MVKEKINPKRKIIQCILIGGVVLGVIGSVLRAALTFMGVLAIPAVTGGGLSGGVPNTFMASFAAVVFTVTPYAVGLGAASTFLYIYFFPDKESRGVLIAWGMLLTLYLIAKIFIPWL